MNTLAKAGCVFLAAGLMVSADTMRKTTGDFFMESYSSQIKKHLASRTAADYRAAEYQAQYEKCGPHHDCVNQTAAGLTAAKTEEAKREFPFAAARLWQ